MLSLSQNNNGHIHGRHLVDTSNSHILNLEGRKLDSFDWDVQWEAEKLQTVILDHNPIQELKKSDFERMNEVRMLSLCDTKVKDLASVISVLRDLPHLEELYFQSTPLGFARRRTQSTICKNTEDSSSSSSDDDDSTDDDQESVYMVHEVKFAEESKHRAGKTRSKTFRRSCELKSLPQTSRRSEKTEVITTEVYGRASRLGGSSDSNIDKTSQNTSKNARKSSRHKELWYELETKKLEGYTNKQKPTNWSEQSESFDESFDDSSDDEEWRAPNLAELRLEEDSSDSDDEDDEEFHREFTVSPAFEKLSLAYTNSLEQEFIYSSPVCFEPNYREFIVRQLPNLKILDGKPITETERLLSSPLQIEEKKETKKDNIPKALCQRELGTHRGYRSSITRTFVNYNFKRDISRLKQDACSEPSYELLSSAEALPRQIEYHPSSPEHMVYGTTSGEVFVLNHVNKKQIGKATVARRQSILGLCWLHHHHGKFITGSDFGNLKLYDFTKMDLYNDGFVQQFANFPQLTSIHVNSTDDCFLASGHSNNVHLYDLASGEMVKVFHSLHSQHINVLKFSHHSPSLFATSSFDGYVKLWDLRDGVKNPISSRKSNNGNVMVCFSPNDKYLLSSAIDNDVRQCNLTDSRCDLVFDIKQLNNPRNYTRSYYINNGDDVIVGGCEENVVHIYNAQTGNFIRDVNITNMTEHHHASYCQSLRGDPFQDFALSVIVGFHPAVHHTELVKINLLKS